jgi:2-keto-3-deoxy-L-rhamnonate aldolase RhmA
VKSTDPAVTEVLAGAGFGALVVDLEHSTLGPADVVAIVRAADTYGVPVVVRVGPAELSGVGRLLETGVAGIQVTEVESAVLLADIRRSVSFAPRGARSVALSHRAGGYGARSLADYLSEEPVTIAQIESRAGVAALPELLASDAQPDVWFIGPLDLSTDLGHPGEVDHREVRAAIDDVVGAVRDSGGRLGVFARDADDARQWVQRGAQLILVGSDVTMLGGAARAAVGALESLFATGVA